MHRSFWKRHLERGEDPIGSVRAIDQIAKNLRQISNLSKALKPGAEVLFFNCSAAYSETGKKFCQDLAKLLVGTNGGFVRASDRDVGIALNRQDANLLQQLLVFGKTEYKVRGSWLDFPEPARGATPTLELKYDDGPSQMVSGQNAELRVTVRANDVPAQGLPITLTAYSIPGSAKECSQTCTMLAARPEVELQVSCKAAGKGRQTWHYLVEAPNVAPLVGSRQYEISEQNKPSSIQGEWYLQLMLGSAPVYLNPPTGTATGFRGICGKRLAFPTESRLLP